MNVEPKDVQATDDAQPESGSAPTPIALIVLFALLVYWGLLYLDDHGGGFNNKVYQPYESYAMVVDRQPVLDTITEARKQGEKIFSAKCAVCHGATGTGLTCPPLAGSDWASAAGPDRIVRLVLNGGGGPITVSGKLITPSATMLSFKDDLKDKEIAAVLTYVRSSWGNTGSLVTEEQVAKIRDAASSRRTPWTATELLAIPLSNPDKK